MHLNLELDIRAAVIKLATVKVYNYFVKVIDNFISRAIMHHSKSQHIITMELFKEH